jgi:uncharacterized protein (DUF1810 family)
MGFDLDRFTQAQDRGGAYIAALAELRAGRKRGHWIWFVFPQLRGLGSSPMAERYGIEGLAEATDYLRHAALRSRLREAAVAVHYHLVGQVVSLRHLMASQIDALKLVSSMTLFEQASRRLQATDPSPELLELATVAGEILAIAERQGSPRCRFTLDVLHL